MGNAAVECATGAPLTDSAVGASTTAWPNSTSSPPSSLLECAHLGEAVRQRKLVGLTVDLQLLAHISPLGWSRILLTGEYRWAKRR